MAQRPVALGFEQRCSLPRPRSAQPLRTRSVRSDRRDGACRRPIAAAASRSPPPPAEASHAATVPASAAQPHPALSRRQLAGVALSATAAAASLAAAPPASADAPAAEAADAAPSATQRPLREAKMVMRVTALRGSVPQPWVEQFQSALEGYGVVALTQRAQLADIYAELAGSAASGGASGKKKQAAQPTTADAVSLGDAWLQRAISAGLIQPIPHGRSYRWWARLSPRWQQLVCRSASSGKVDPGGEVWAAPYRWGAVLVAYRADKLARSGLPGGIRDWGDLLAPQLKGRVAFHDSPRDVLGAAFKTLGLGYNTTAAQAGRCGIAEDDLRRRVQRLVQQVRVFSNSDHLRALGAGEVDVVVGWSEDILPAVLRSNDLQVAAPLSGTSLWADCWCIPTAAAGGAEDGEPSPLLPAWLELGLQPVQVQRHKGLRGGASPLLLPGRSLRPSSPRPGGAACSLLEPAEPPTGTSVLQEYLPCEEVLERSEFLLPLDAETAALYRRLLQA